MKRKGIQILIGVLLVILLSIISISVYYLTVDIQTQVPNQLEDNIKIETEQFMSRKIFMVSPKETSENHTRILYFHGGSYVAEASKEHWEFIKNLVMDTGVTVILPDYPLTPKYTYQDVFQMVVPFYKEMIERVEPEDLIIMGDSAGGGLSLALVEKMGEEKLPMPRQTILISPWLDTKLDNPKIEEVQRFDKQLNKDTLKLAGIAYAGEDGENSYLVNPIDGDLTKLKNVTILTGTHDILNPDAHTIQEKAKKAGNAEGIQIKEYEEATHIWMIEKTASEELIEQGYQEILNLIKN